MDKHTTSRRRVSSARVGALSLLAAAAWLVAARAGGVSSGDLHVRRERIAAIDAEAASLESAAARARAARARLANLEGRAAMLEGAVLFSGSPAHALEQISALAAGANLRIARLAPAPVAARSRYADWTCTLSATGTFEDVQAFFERASDLAPAIRVDGFVVRRTANAGGGLLTVDVIFKALTKARPVATHDARDGMDDRRRRPLRTPTDPFRDTAAGEPSALKEGLKNVRIDDVAVHGVLTGRADAVALLAGPDRRTYLARPGTELRDGRVKTIARGAVTFTTHRDDNREQDVVVPLSRVRR